MAPRTPPLLDALLALKPNVIYTMAAAKTISAASKAFSQGAVKSFRWGQSGQVLEARMAYEGRPSILFSVANGKLQSSASPESSQNERHVLAAIMTIMRVLLGAKFHLEDLSPASIEKFRRELKAPQLEVERPRVILREGASGARFELDFDSGLRETSWRVAGPPSGMEWLKWQEREPERVGEAFCRWLPTKPATMDIEVRAGGTSLVFCEAHAGTVHSRTQIALRDEKVLIERAIVDSSGTPLGPFLDLGYDLVFVPGAHIFGQAERPVSWNELAKAGAVLLKNRSVQIPAVSFLALYPPKVSDSCTLLDRRGSAVEPLQTECGGLLEAVTEGSCVRIRLRVNASPGVRMPAHPSLVRPFEPLFADGAFTLLVGGPARRRRLAEKLVEMVLLKELREIEEILKEIEEDPAFTSRHMHGEEAAKCLRYLFSQFRTLDEVHLVADDSHDTAPWRICTGAGTALARALAAFLRAFPGADAFQAKALTFEIEGVRFFQELPALVKACEALGVELRLDEHNTRIEKLTLSVRVIPSGQQDWFELHPEARAGALTLPHSQWEQVLRSGHLRDSSGTLVTFDADSLALLRTLAGLVGSKPAGSALRLPRVRLFDWVALRTQGIACELPAVDDAVLQSLLSLETVPRHPLPSGLRAELREYQRHGFDWLCFLYKHRFGACLADDMGLGKTVQAIAFLVALKEGSLARQNPGSHAPHLVVLPATLVFNWQSELQKFAPGLRVHEYTGQERSLEFGDADIVLTTYGLVQRDIEALSGVAFDVAIFDEAQAIKNATAARSRAAAQLQTRFRLCITGTPLENHLGEFHSIMETAVPGLLGERKDFLRDHEAGLPVLDRVRPFLLRRTKEKILSELPPKVESDAYFALSEAQRECYTRAVGEVRAQVLAAYEDRPAQQAGIMALAALLRLRQICISPAMLSEQFDSGSPKIEYLVGQLGQLAEEGHAALVFSQFLKGLDLTASALTAAGLPFLRMDGSTPQAERKKLVESFQAGEAPGIFLISLKTGGTGLNLTRASYVFHLDPWWNPATENQASDRVHRIGQKRSVFVQRLLMRHTIEEKMMTLKLQKQALFAAVLDNSGPAAPDGAAALSAADFRFLIEG